jgi:hypothetical protein
MKGRIAPFWRRRRGDVGDTDRARERSGDAPDVGSEAVEARVSELALPDPEQPAPQPPEQPVLLTPAGERRPVRVGVLLPARRRAWPLSIVRLPAVPRRAILAAGVCAGLVGPTVARHLATRLLLGRSAARAEGVLEITRIVYTGPLTPRAAAAIGKALIASRR